MTRALAIVERDLRKFFRSPMLLFASLFLPLVQLVILGNAFGGNIKNVQIGVVNEDRGPEAVGVLEKLNAVEANARTFVVDRYADRATALHDLREGAIGAVVIIPEHYSRDLLSHHDPKLAVVTDNSDQFVSNSVTATMSALVSAINMPDVAPRDPTALNLDVVELYPYINYMKYLLPGSITLSIFVTAMIGGGIIYLDDKSRGVHEGYLVTPITKFELILGFNLAGVTKGILSGLVVLILGALLAGIPGLFEPLRLFNLLLLTVVTATALIAMMFFIVARMNDPLTPRAIFGVLNTLLFFPSGAVYPIAAFPPWMRVIARVDPFSFAVHGYRSLLLTQAGLAGVYSDILILIGISITMLLGATLLFRRTF
ncbi:MAG: ABC transporter permease [Acidobacteriota bacterium]|nr:ABC transporter permease [Acidobacteriota bacterium]